MKQLLTLISTAILIALLTTATFAVATETSEVVTPTEVKYTPKFGTVTFNHTKHLNRADCSSCHHTGENSECKSCHGIDTKILTAKKAYHNKCKSCHIERQQGPMSCNECHIK